MIYEGKGHDPKNGIIRKKWADMEPTELYQYEIWLEEQRARTQTSINLLRDHMKERGLDTKPIYYGF